MGSSLTSTASTTKSTTKATGTAVGAPDVPEPARQHTNGGAKAFARYYMSVLNDTDAHPRTGVLKPLALESCKSCKNHQNVVRKLVARSLKFNQRQMAVKYVSLNGSSELATFVEIRGYVPKADIVDKDGRPIQSFPEVRDHGLMFELKWTSNGWRVATIKNVL
ncbi:MAG TPA: DUF6318 family protein [Flexivirga sp.]|uniref:DUF6318 family protein n=1 Tax=Flexivirga sp. TaxID=1962927 RepID=UPI002C0C10D3|nr:DUF6318 family protein [Flexivirga sp.]HWC22736.1 DUF6318 family protein [Flexivirga sp.]